MTSFLPAGTFPSPATLGLGLGVAIITAFLLILFPLIILVTELLNRLSTARKLSTIPSPGNGWDALFWGRSTLPMPNAPSVMRQWALEYGELFRLRIGWYDWVVVNSPEAFRELFDKQSIATSSKIPAPIGHDLVTGDLRMFTMPYGPRWRAHRAIMHKLLAPKPTAEFVPSQEFEVKQLLHHLGFENGDQSAWFEHVRRMSFSIVTTSTYGRPVDDADLRNAGESSALLGRITRPGAFIEDDIPLLARWLPERLQPSRRQAKKYADIILRGKMRAWNQLKEEVESGKAPPSFGRDLAQSDFRAQGLTDEDAAWITGGLVEAGAEITAVVIQNLMLYLAATPAAQARAHEELDRVLQEKGKEPPTFADLPRLPYIRACVKEILRLCPVPTWAVKHFTDAEVSYQQHRIPKGTVLLANTSFMHWDPSRFPQPHVFRPERFLGFEKSSAEYAVSSDPRQRDHFTFGGGRRICPASRLAENTLDIVAANVLWAFDLRPPAGQKEMDTSDEAFKGDAFRGPKPFQLRFVPRSEGHLESVRLGWERARESGYELRGQLVGGGHGVKK